MRGTINEDAARALKQSTVLWDYANPGFGLRRQGEIAVFFVRYRQNGVRRQLTLGREREMSAAEARTKALVILDAAAKQKIVITKWQIRRSKSGNKFFGEVAERYLETFAIPRKKRSSVLSDRRNLELHILPAIGDLRLTQIDRPCIMGMHASLQKKPIAANRCLAIISRIFTIAAKWGLCDDENPCQGIDRYPEKPRERYLTDEELERLGHALRISAQNYVGIDWANYSLPQRLRRASSEDWRSIIAIKLLLLTGARMTEVLSLRWDSIDKKLGIARLSDSKTGLKYLYLPPQVISILDGIKDCRPQNHLPSPFVLPGDRPCTHFQGLFQPWQRIRAIAELPQLRIHDLRHAFASTAVAGGDSLYIVGRILGHRRISTTERYAHLAVSPTLDVASRTANKLAQFL
jgi:integrase